MLPPIFASTSAQIGFAPNGKLLLVTVKSGDAFDLPAMSSGSNIKYSVDLYTGRAIYPLRQVALFLLVLPLIRRIICLW